jgi:hypothetical protein
MPIFSAKTLRLLHDGAKKAYLREGFARLSLNLTASTSSQQLTKSPFFDMIADDSFFALMMSL